MLLKLTLKCTIWGPYKPITWQMTFSFPIRPCPLHVPGILFINIIPVYLLQTFFKSKFIFNAEISHFPMITICDQFQMVPESKYRIMISTMSVLRTHALDSVIKDNFVYTSRAPNRGGGGVRGVATPPEFWKGGGGLNTCQPP